MKIDFIIIIIINIDNEKNKKTKSIKLRIIIFFKYAMIMKQFFYIILETIVQILLKITKKSKIKEIINAIYGNIYYLLLLFIL